MQINRRVALLALPAAFLALLSACNAEHVVPARPSPTPSPGRTAEPMPMPAPAPSPSAAPPAALPPSVAGDWRDAPLTPGAWRYGVEGSGTVASFQSDSGARLLALTCHRERGALLLTRAGQSAVPVPMSLTTSYGTRNFSMASLSPTDATLDLSLPARDPALDEMAFSRGRMMVQVNGLPTLILPVWAEIGRVIEDCRG